MAQEAEQTEAQSHNLHLCIPQAPSSHELFAPCYLPGFLNASFAKSTLLPKAYCCTMSAVMCCLDQHRIVMFGNPSKQGALITWLCSAAFAHARPLCSLRRRLLQQQSCKVTYRSIDALIAHIMKPLCRQGGIQNHSQHDKLPLAFAYRLACA